MNANDRYYAKNKERILKKRKVYYKKNRDKMLAYNKLYKLDVDAKIKADNEPITLNLPKTLEECSKMRELNGGPCHHIGCKWHVFTAYPKVYLRQIENMEIDDDKMLEKMFENETCILSISEDSNSLNDIAIILKITRERVRQIVKSGLRQVKKLLIINHKNKIKNFYLLKS